MALIAYALGNNIIAASRPDDAVAAMELCEPPDRWQLADVRELTADEMALPVDDTSPETVEEALARIESASARSRLDIARHGTGQLIRWDYPSL
jgi:hypothetical protein